MKNGPLFGEGYKRDGLLLEGTSYENGFSSFQDQIVIRIFIRGRDGVIFCTKRVKDDFVFSVRTLSTVAHS